MSTTSQPLPAAWSTATVGDVVEPKVEQTGPTGNEFTYVDISSIDNGRKVIVEPKSLMAADAPSRARQVLKRGDVLVSMTRPNLNAVALVPNGLDRSIASTGFCVLRARRVDPRWLYYYVQTPSFIEAMKERVQGALYPAVRPKDILGHSFPLAPLAEQRRIVAELEKQFTRLYAGVADLERVRLQLKRYRAAVLRAGCEGRLVPTEAELARREGRDCESGENLLARILKERRARWEEEQLAQMKAVGKSPADAKWKSKYKDPALGERGVLPPVPSGWCWAAIDTIGFVTKLAGFEYTKFVHYDPTGELPVIKAENAGPEGFRVTDFSRVRRESVAALRRSQLRPADVLMVFVGAGTGKVALVPPDREYFLGPNIALIRPTTPMVLPQYLELFLRSPSGKQLTLRLAKAVAQPSLSMGSIRTIPVAVPPPSEQRRIVEEVERRLSVADAVNGSVAANVSRASRLRDAVLQAAFAGELVRVAPPDRPVGSPLLPLAASTGGKELARPRRTRKAGTA